MIDNTALKQIGQQLQNLDTISRLPEKPDFTVEPIISPFVSRNANKGNWGYHYHQIEALKTAWLKEMKRKVIVFVLDTEGTLQHECFTPAKNYLPEYEKTFTGEDKTASNGHGTGCASIIAGIRPDGTPLGLGPEGWVYVVPVKGLHQRGYGYGSWLMAGMEYVLDVWNSELKKEGVAVHLSASLGGPTPIKGMQELSREMTKSGIFLHFAAGNNGYREGQNTIGYPAKENVGFAIGSISENATPSGFSSAGPDLDFVYAGEMVESAWYSQMDTYLEWSGTSAATPAHAAYCAWITGRFPHIKTMEQLYAVCRENAIDLWGTGFDERTAWGTNKGVPKVEIPGEEPDPAPDPGEKYPASIVECRIKTRQPSSNRYEEKIYITVKN